MSSQFIDVGLFSLLKKMDQNVNDQTLQAPNRLDNLESLDQACRQFTMPFVQHLLRARHTLFLFSLGERL